MADILRLIHVIGWAAWFGLAIAEASLGVQVRKADGAARPWLARVWGRIGTAQLIAVTITVVFGLGLFAFELATFPLGADAMMKAHAYLFIHIMLALGIVAAVFALLAARSRGEAVSAAEKGDSEAFSRNYKRASMFSGIATLLILATIAEVYLRAL